MNRTNDVKNLRSVFLLIVDCININIPCRKCGVAFWLCKIGKPSRSKNMVCSLEHNKYAKYKIQSTILNIYRIFDPINMKLEEKY